MPEGTRILFLDCQTTGARPGRGHVLEVAWGVTTVEGLREGGLPHIHARLCRLPEGETVPPAITRLTGITPAAMGEAHEAADVVRGLAEAVAAVDHAVIHYASFEQPFLEDMWQTHVGQAFPLPILCTHKLAKALYPTLPSRSIRALAGYFGWPLTECKRAGGHVEGTAHILRALLDEIATRGADRPWDEVPALLATAGKVSRKKTYPMPDATRLSLPTGPGIYIMKDRRGAVLYVGKATSLRARVNSYFRGQKNRDPRKQEMLTQAVDIETRETASAVEAALLENELIKAWRPPYNAALKNVDKRIYGCGRDLAPVQGDEPFVYGPFAHGHFRDLFAFLKSCAGEGELAEAPSLYLPDDPELRQEVRGVLRATVGDAVLANPRALLARGIWALRRHVKEREEREAAGEDEETDGADRDAEAMESLTEDDEATTLEDWTPEEWAEALLGSLRQAARQAVRARWLKRLADSAVFFAETRGKGRLLVLRGGRTGWRADAQVPRTFAEATAFATPWDSDGEEGNAWTPLSYDRVGVLLQECAILARKGGRLAINDADGKSWDGTHMRERYIRITR